MLWIMILNFYVPLGLNVNKNNLIEILAARLEFICTSVFRSQMLPWHASRSVKSISIFRQRLDSKLKC